MALKFTTREGEPVDENPRPENNDELLRKKMEEDGIEAYEISKKLEPQEKKAA